MWFAATLGTHYYTTLKSADWVILRNQEDWRSLIPIGSTDCRNDKMDWG